MSARRLLITSVIITVLGVAAGAGLGYMEGGWLLEEVLFLPVWFIGIYFCGTPWKRIFKIWLALEGIKAVKRITTGDRYHVAETLAGGCIFAFILTLGWIYGLGKFIYYIVLAVRERNCKAF